MHPTFIFALTAFALLHPSLGAEYPVPPAVVRPSVYHANKPSAVYSGSLPANSKYPTHHNGGSSCCHKISLDGRCGAYNGATCLGSGYGNCCGYVTLGIDVSS
jgi:hypothetical protein